MLNVPELDDQRFDDIVENAVNRIPYLYPEWTDFNEHDPGITLIELFAWYKQMQQYHLNQITDRNRRMFLKLLGVRPFSARPARAAVALAPSMKGRRLCEGTIFHSEGGVPFELEEALDGSAVHMEEAYFERQGELHEITALLQGGEVPISLRGREEGEALYLGFSGAQEREELRLWIEIAQDYPVARNPFAKDSPLPRAIAFETMHGAERRELEIVLDETAALSHSGKLVLRCPGGVPVTDGGKGLPQRCYVVLSIPEAGCEEAPALLSVTADFAEITQRTTCSEVHEFTLQEGEQGDFSLRTRLAVEGDVDVFVRDGKGWLRLEQFQSVLQGEELPLRRVSFQPPSLKADGQPNVRIVCYLRSFKEAMRQDAAGLPGQTLRLFNYGEEPDVSRLKVMCLSCTGRDDWRYLDWRYTDCLEGAGPMDPVYTCDGEEGVLRFGDNVEGAAPEQGREAIYVAAFSLTKGEDGALPLGQNLYCAGLRPGRELMLPPYGSDEERREEAGSALHVVPGRDRESVDGAVLRMQEIWTSTSRAATEEDYENIAKATPGRRVAVARAIPLYNPQSNLAERTPAMLTLVVLPYSGRPFPMPDERFLGCVRQQVEKYRPICTEVRVIPPVYVGVSVRVDVIAREREELVKEEVRRALDKFFAVARGEQVGRPVQESAVIGAVGGAGSVLGVAGCTLGSTVVGCRVNKHGDVVIPRHAIAYLSALEVHIFRQ